MAIRSPECRQTNGGSKALNSKKKIIHSLLATLAFAAIVGVVGLISFYLRKSEILYVAATGTSTDTVESLSFEVRVYEFSSSDDQNELATKFVENGRVGLVSALVKMRSKGSVLVTGRSGIFDLKYVREVQSSNGRRKLLFVISREGYAEEIPDANNSGNSKLSMMEMILTNGSNEGTGIFIPNPKFRLDSESHLEAEPFQDPWLLTGIRVSRW